MARLDRRELIARQLAKLYQLRGEGINVQCLIAQFEAELCNHHKKETTTETGEDKQQCALAA